MRNRRVMLVFGTRPEAIKMFPVVHALKRMPGIETRVCVTAQHRQLLDQVLALAGIAPDLDLDIMQPEQSLDALTARLITALGGAFDPDRVLVHGDTLTAMCASLAAHYRRIPMAHVEAGLRSGDIHHPWPEEVARRVIACIADLNFAPTQSAAAALTAEGRGGVHMTGNTVLDALLATRAQIRERPEMADTIMPILRAFAGRRIIAVTSHRRENLGAGIRGIASSVKTIAERPDVAIIFPVHPNPAVRSAMEDVLSGLTNVALIEPLDYANFVALLDACEIVLTDSGGVQEEAPTLGKPVLVMREKTERPKGVAAGTARLVGVDKYRIVEEVNRLLDDPGAYARMARACSPFGDGKAAPRIAKAVAAAFGVEEGEAMAAPDYELLDS